MLSIEEYIAKRKKEDKLNEWDAEKRTENLKACVDYVFEYFDNVLNITEGEQLTALKGEKLDKYRKALRYYSDPQVIDWLVGIYSEYDKKMSLIIGNVLKEDEFFLLSDSDQDFRRLSYDCYATLVKRYPLLRDQHDMLFQFIKDHHKLLSGGGPMANRLVISEGLDEWVQDTWAKHKVDLLKFAESWINYFDYNKDLWPASHKIRTGNQYLPWDYDYKQKTNLFDLDSLYRKMPKKPFTRGRKQEFEILMMYYWLHVITTDDAYWQEYLDKTLPSLKNK